VHLDLATLSLVGALQALLLAPLLLAATRAYAGVARRSLRIWGAVLLLQALGWALTAMRGHASGWVSIVLGNGALLASYAGTAYTLRLLLGVPPRRTLLAVVALGGWLGIIWFSQVQPDYAARVYAVTVALGAMMALILWPLRHAARRGGSNAQRVMLLVLLAALGTWALRLHELALSPTPATWLLAPTLANTAQMIYSALEPVFASVGFLLMYNEMAQAQLRHLARTDPLTGTLNRLALDEAATAMFRQATARPPAVLMIDADHFKAINDRFGHDGGDRVLAALAQAITRALRHDDVLGRVGGEEFLVLLPDSGLDDAMALAERLRADVEAVRVMLDGAPLAVTVSIGVAARTDSDTTPAALVRRADRALYAAKHAGRNRVAAAPAA